MPAFDRRTPPLQLAAMCGIDPTRPAGDHRERLMAGFLRACAEHGYAHVTIDKIVANASVSKTTYYEIFGDKQKLLLAAHEELSAKLLARVDGACRLNGGADPGTVIVATALGHLAEQPAAARLLCTEVLAAEEEGSARLQTLLAELASRFEGSPLGRPRAEAALALMLVYVARAAAEGDPEAIRAIEPRILSALEL